MPGQGEDFEPLTQLLKLGVRRHQRSAGAHRQLRRKTIGQSKFVPCAKVRSAKRCLLIHANRFDDGSYALRAKIYLILVQIARQNVRNLCQIHNRDLQPRPTRLGLPNEVLNRTRAWSVTE